MQVSVSTGIQIINDNEWLSCRYTKGEGFCLDDNAQGISLEYTAVFVDNLNEFISQGGQVSEKIQIRRIAHPDLTYILDVDSIKDEDIPDISSVHLTPSTLAINKFLSDNPSIEASVCLSPDESFTMVSCSVEIEAFRESSDQ